MSTPEQRKRLKKHYRECSLIHAAWAKHGYQYPPPKTEPFPPDLIDLECGAKIRAEMPSKQKATYAMRALLTI